MATFTDLSVAFLLDVLTITYTDLYRQVENPSGLWWLGHVFFKAMENIMGRVLSSTVNAIDYFSIMNAMQEDCTLIHTLFIQ